jgi:hypothetical protein
LEWPQEIPQHASKNHKGSQAGQALTVMIKQLTGNKLILTIIIFISLTQFSLGQFRLRVNPHH